MPDLQKLQSDKEKIINTIRSGGPSFPARISREVQIPPLFVSAILSELVSEKHLKVSNMKVGSSPVYLLPGQEERLSEFSHFLSHKEKEAFTKLKEFQILSDEEQEPAVRVALRSIKDFAVPLAVKIRGETKTFWKYFTLKDDDAVRLIQQAITPQKLPEITEPLPEPAKENPTSPLQSENSLKNAPPALAMQTSQKEKKEKSPKAKKPVESKFAVMVRDYLFAKDFEILEEISVKKKEFTSKTRLDTTLGKQEYYTIAKEKKKITEQDLALALQKAQEDKMPALVLAPGELDKTAKPFLQQYRNLVKFEKLRL